MTDVLFDKLAERQDLAQGLLERVEKQILRVKRGGSGTQAKLEL